MSVPSIAAVAYVVGGTQLEWRQFPQSQPSMTSYSKGGVESWRVARPGQGSLVPQAPRSSGHTASAPGPSPDTDLWDRGITIKPAMRTTQMVAQDDSRTQAHMHVNPSIFMHLHKHLYVSFDTDIHKIQQITKQTMPQTHE